MAEVILRNLDDDVVASLKFEAELHGHSLEQELREILKRGGADGRGKARHGRSDRAMTPERLEDDSADLIREDRDSR